MGNEGNTTEVLGKKIFFLYPSVLIQNELAEELIQQEFEVYIIKDHEKLRRILKKYPESIVLVNINDRLPEDDCEAWIRGVMGSSETSKTEIGVFSSVAVEELQRKYLNVLKIHCGFITVKSSDIQKAIRQLLEALKTVEAKGMRKYIRATSENEALTAINIPVGGRFVNGTIKDISTMGLSCTFEEDPELEKNTLCQDVQVKLQTMILKLEVIVFGSRNEGDSKIYVLILTQRTDPAVRTKIRKYVQATLQNKIEKEIK
jgi:hypothetical protein